MNKYEKCKCFFILLYMLLRHMGVLSNVVQPFFLILEGFDDSNYRNENVPEAAGPEHIVFEIEII